MIFFPINIHNNHWVSIQVDLSMDRISYLDSFHVSQKEVGKNFKIIEKFMNLMDSMKNTQPRKWNFEIDNGFPKQRNSSDCGVFMLKGIHYKALRSERMFSQTDIPYFRILITAELIKGKLLNSI